jgi:membrane protease YdiL (CAAX protease family)
VKRTNGPVIGSAAVAALVLAALLPPLRIPLLLGLVAMLVVAGRRRPWRWALAGAIPVALILVWGELVGRHLLEDVFVCADPASLVAWLRAAEAVLVITTITLLAWWLGTTLRALGLARPTGREVAIGLAAILLVPIPSLYLGPLLAEPFFGRIDLDLGSPLAIVPALVLGLANGTMEELAYRGALMSWLSRVAGPSIGLVGQAVVFGVAHTGSDFVGPVLPVVLAVMAGGLVAGLIVRRTGSLWIPIAAHVAIDVPLYYAAACRLGAN